MTDARTLVERELERVDVRPLPVDGFHRRRDRRQRTRQIATGVVAAAIAAVGIAFAFGALGPAERAMPAATRIGSIVFLDGGQLMSVAPDGSTRANVLSPDWREPLEGADSPCSPPKCGAHPVYAWSPDGTQLGFVWGRLGEPGSSGTIYEIRGDGTGAVRPVGDCSAGSPSSPCTSFAWAPDGSRVAFVTDDLLWLSTGRRGAERVTTTTLTDFDWSPDGTRIAYVTGNADVLVDALDGNFVPTVVGSAVGGARSVDWSHDGDRLLVTSSARSSEGTDAIVTIDLATGRQTQLVPADPDRFLADASWSPDGSHITWAAFPGRRSFGGPGGPFSAEIWVALADGSEARRVYETGCCVAGQIENAFTGPVFSPDGREIAFSVIGDDQTDLPNDTGVYVMSIDGQNLRQVSPTGIFPTWQPLP